MGDKDDNGQFVKGNQANLSHGGAGALSRIHDGQEFIGIAAQEERQVQIEIDADGILPVITKGARRLETAARLYWNALQAASERGDLQAMTAFVKVFGWLQSSAIRSLFGYDPTREVSDHVPELNFSKPYSWLFAVSCG